MLASVSDFEKLVKNFDVDEEIDLHRQDKNYKSVFTIRQSLEDFEAYHDKIKKLLKKLKVSTK